MMYKTAQEVFKMGFNDYLEKEAGVVIRSVSKKIKKLKNVLRSVPKAKIGITSKTSVTPKLSPNQAPLLQGKGKGRPLSAQSQKDLDNLVAKGNQLGSLTKAKEKLYSQTGKHYRWS